MTPALYYASILKGGELSHQVDEYNGSGSVPIGDSESSEAYLVFNSQGENNDSFYKLQDLLRSDVQIENARLVFSLEGGAAGSFTVNAYPLLIDAENFDKFNKCETLPAITDGILASGLLCAASERDVENIGGYSINLLNEIATWTTSGRLSDILSNGYFGYALRLTGGNADISAVQLVITYLESEETAPSQAVIEAADAMLAARENIQQSLEGSGTVSDPYLIFTADQLCGMVENDNACYKLMRDIDLEGYDWRPVGYYYWYPFMGYLDGNGHTIKNLYVGGTGNDAWDINAGGLFGYLEGRVENLHVETVKAKRKGVDFFGYAGGIAGVANAPAEIINCSVNGYISGNNRAGGLVGIAYPGVIIENCCAIGTVDMSQAFAYINDNGLEFTKEVWDTCMSLLVWGAGVYSSFTGTRAASGSEKKWNASDYADMFTSIVTKFPIDELFNTGSLQKLRKCCVGGLVGLNYATIKNSYSSTDIEKPRSSNYLTIGDWGKTGGVVGRNMEDYADVSNCFYNIDCKGNDDNEGGVGTAKTTEELKNANLFGPDESSAKEQWNHDLKLKSADGLPLPVCNYVNRNMNGNYQPDVYYDSRVLMKTRESFFLGTETEDGSLICSKCVELKENLKKETDESTKAAIEKQIAVTGIYQRGSDARPYHVHDLDSLLAMQDNKESHFILCCDIDFKVSNGNSKTVQKYWWPAGKTHFSPIKGSLKGNTSCNSDTYIYEAGEIKPLSVENKADRFTIKNLTVQSNRHAGLFASFRGTFSDINIELAQGTWSSWRDGIKNPESSSVVGIFTIGNKASAGAVAGETVNGALIRDCFVSGGTSSNNVYMPGYIKGAIRTGGIVGMNNRGSELDGCDAYVDMDARNFETVYLEDDAGTNIDIIHNAILSIDSIISVCAGIADVESVAEEMKNNKSIGVVKEFIQALGHAAQVAITPSVWYSTIEDFPIIKYFVLRYSDVCIGGLVGENYGNIMNTCIAVKESSISAAMAPFGTLLNPNLSLIPYFNTLHRGRVVGRNNWVAGANVAAKRGNLAQTSSFSTAEVSIHSPLVASKANRSMNLEGKGTESEPFITRTEGDIKELATIIKEGRSQGIYIKQVKDISLSDGSEFKGFEGSFEGTYDGNGYSISGLTTNRPLFAGLSAACVKNLILKNSIIMSEAAFATTAENGSRIQNCGLERNVQIGGEGAPAVAGFVGSLTDSAIYNVYNYAVMRSSSVVCGIAREIKGSSEVVSCYTDTKQPTPPTQDAENSTPVTVYAVAQSVAATADYRYCRWSIASDAGTATATDKRSGQKKNADKSGRLTEAESWIFTLCNLLEGNAQESDKSELGYTNDATWALGEPVAEGEIRPGFYFYGYRLQGSGTKEQPYIISDALDFEHFTQKIRLMADTEDIYFKQTADIEINSAANDNLTANSKASDYNSFKGCYDGGYHSLSKITIDNAKTGDNTTAASIFGVLEGATVKNLGIKGSTFKAARAAAIATEGTDRACLDGSEKRNLIQNCWTESDVEINGSIYAGGLLGDMEKTDVYACASYASVGSENATGGGIAYKLTSGEVRLCISAGSLSGENKYRLALLSETESRDNYLIGTGAGEMSATNLSDKSFLDSVNDTAVRSGITALGEWIITKTENENDIIIPSETELKPTEQDGKVVYADRTSRYIDLDYEDFSAGKGTRAEPYEIYSIEELARVNHHIKEGTYFRLMADLDFSNYCKTHDWVAIGTDADYFAFQGVFDGNGYTISNLTMTSSSTAGLFGYCAGTIKNLKVVNFNINTTGSSAGAIVGELCAGGRVEQCAVAYADGKETHIDSAHYSGGIVGVAQKGSVIRNVYADRVHASLSNILVLNGGEDSLLGGARDSSTLSAGFTDGWSVVGEFIGILDTLTKASGLFSTDFFSSLSVLINTMQDSDYRTAAAGGIVGFLGGTLEDSWVWRKANASDSMSSATAGLLSAYQGEGVGRRFYGSVVGENQSVNVPGLKAVGSDDNGELSNKNYIIVESTSIDNLGINSPRWNGRELKVFENEMRGLSGVESVFDLEKELSAIEPAKDIDGYYMVSNANELAYIEFDPYSNYKLMNDIDLSGYNWVPLCRQRDQYFAATLDGQGYSIYGLHVETNENGGLFGYVLGTVTNLNIGVDVVDAYGSAGAVAAGVYYPGKLSKVSVVPTAVAKAMIAERIISVFKKDEDQIPSTEQALLKSLLGAEDAPANKTKAEARIKAVYTANDIQDKDYSDKAHIIGGGNDDGAGVGGLVGIVGKDVDVKDCYSRVNVSNANFAVVKSFDLTGFVLGLIDSLTEILDPIVSRGASIASAISVWNETNELLEAYNAARKLYEEDLGKHNLSVDAEAKIEEEVETIDRNRKELQTEIDNCETNAKAAEEQIKELDAQIEKLNEKQAKDGKLSESDQEILNDCKKKKTEEQTKMEGYNKQKKINLEEKGKLESDYSTKLNEFNTKKSTNRENEKALKDQKEKLDKQAKDYNSRIDEESSLFAPDFFQAIVQFAKAIGDTILDLKLSSYDSCVGGLVGECRGRLVNCYTVGKLEYKFSGIWSWINGGVHYGTLVGRIRHGGSASSNGRIGSLGQMISNCYYYPENTGDNSFGNKIRDWHPMELEKVGENIDNGGKKTPIFKQVYAENWMYTALDGFDFSSTWKKGAYSMYPELVSPLEASAYAMSSDARMMRPFAQGSGTEEDPYIISTVLEFLDMAKYRKEEYYYKLACDIDLTPDNGNGNYVNSCIDLSTDFFGGIGYGLDTGIFSGYDVDLDFDGDAFAGHFDGNGYKIRYTEKVWSKEDIENIDPYYYACGLFPVLSGSIENLELECTGIAPKARYRGLIAGRMLAGSRVENVRVSYQGSATLVAQVAVGGMVGSVEKGAYIGNCVLDAPNLDFSVEKESIFVSERIASIIGENGGTAEYLIARTGHDGAVRANTLTGGVSHELWHGKSDGSSTYANGQISLPGAATERDWVNRGFDFNNTWTMDEAKPALRCLRSTDKYQYYSSLRDKACEAINAKEITMTDSDIYKHQGEQASISGIGTESSPFAISSPKDFMAMMYAISGAGDAAGRSYSGVYFEQTEDICLDLKELAGIKYTKNNVETSILGDGVFGGNYDGNGHIIELTDTGSGIGLPKLFKSLSGATFRNCIFIAPKNQEEQTSILLAEKASNSLFLNCDLIKVNKLADSMSDVSMLNNLYENPAVFDGIVKSDCFNGRIVGLEDAAEAAFINNKQAVDSYTEETTETACAELNLMTGLPEEIKKMAYAWSSDGLRYRPSTDAYETVNFDLGEGVEIKSVGDLNGYHTLPESTYIRDGSKLVAVRVPAGTKLNLELSYTGTAREEKYVVITGEAAGCKPNLKELILALACRNTEPSESSKVNADNEQSESTAPDTDALFAQLTEDDYLRAAGRADTQSSGGIIGTLPSDTTQLRYEVGSGDNIISIYKQNTPYKAELIFNKPFVGASVKKVRFCFTERIYEELEPEELQIEGLNNHLVGEQTVSVLRPVQTLDEDGNPTVENMRFETKVSLWDLDNFDSLSIDTWPSRYYYLRDDVKAGAARLIDLSGAKIYAKKNGTVQIIDIEDMFAELPDGKISQYYEVEPITGSDGEYEDADPTGTHRIALKTPELSEAPNNQPIWVTMWIRHQAITFQICIVDEIPLTSIEISKLPAQTAITEGQAIDLTGGKLKLHYDTYRTEEIDLESDEVSASLGLTDENGRAKVTVSYQGCTTTYTVASYTISIDSVKSWGTTQRYRIDTPINYEDWQIKIWYNNSTQEIKSLKQILAEKKPGEDTHLPTFDDSSLPQDVSEQLRNYTIRYKGHEVSFAYYVYERDLTGLSYVADSLTAVQYKGLPFNTSGGQLVASYSNNTTKTIELGSDKLRIEIPDGALDVVGKFAVTDEVPITVSYTEGGITKSTRINVSVENPVQSVVLTKKDTARTTYPRGVYDEPLYSDYNITVNYAEGSGLRKEEKTLQEAMAWNGLRFGRANIVWTNGTGFDGSTPGEYEFKLKYEGVESEQSFSVDVCDFQIAEVNINEDFKFIAGMELSDFRNVSSMTIRYRTNRSAEGQTSAPADEIVSLRDAAVDITSSEYDPLSLSMASLGRKEFAVTYGINSVGEANTFTFVENVIACSLNIVGGPEKVVLDKDGKPLDSTYWGKIQLLSLYNQQIGTVDINNPDFERRGSIGSYTVSNLPANAANYSVLTTSGIGVNQIASIALPSQSLLKTNYVLGEKLKKENITVSFTVDSADASATLALSDADVQIGIAADAYNSDTPDGSASTDANAAKTLKKLGNHNVTVAYGGATASYNISVEAAGIEKVDGYEPKRKYLDGERINFSDMRIKVLGAGNTNFGTYRLNEQGIANLQSKLGGTLSLKERETVISDQTKLSVGQGSTRTAFISVCYGGKQISNPIAITIYRASDSISVQADRRGTAWYGKPNEVNAGSELAVKNNGYSGSSAYYSRKAYVQFDLSDCIKYASDNDLKIDSLTLSFKAKNNSKDPIQRKTKLFDVLGTWPTAQEGGVTVNKLTWNTAKSFTVGTWSSNVNIKEEKTFTLTIPKSLIRDKLILGMESVDKNGGDMQYIYADGTMKLKVNYALNKEVKEIKDITGYKDTYMRGSSIDKSQGSLRVVYTDDSSATMSFAQLEDEAFGYNFSPADSAADEATVRITYGGKTAEYTVELVENGVSEITGISDTEFKLGQQMKSSEVSLYVRYKDGSTGSIPMSDGRITIGRNGVGTYSASSIGTQEVTIYCSGLAQGYDASVNVEAVYIDWVQMPSKRSGYYVGEELDLTRGSIKAYGYSVSGSSRPESAALSLLKSDGALSDGISVSGDVLQSSNGKLVLKKAGTNTINIHYGGRTLSYSVTAEEPWVTEITGLAAYSGGEDCILLGDRRSDSSKCIYVKYADGSSGLLSLGSSRNATAANITITGCGADAGKSWNVGTSAANSLSSTVGVKHINISYSQPGHSIVQKNNYEISVAPVSLSLSSVKTDYVHNQEFDRTQGSITAIGINNVTQESIALTADGVTINGYDKTKIGTRLVTLGYMGKSASIQVTVAPKAVSEIRITKLPTAKYCEGQNSIDLTGGQIVRRYNDGTEDLTAIDMVDEDTNNVGVVSVKEKGEDGSWTLLEGSTYDMSAGNTYRITLAYAGKRAHYDVVADYNYSSFKLDVSGSKYTIKKSGSNTLSTDPGALAVKNNTNNTGANTRFSYMSFSLGNSAMGDLADILDDNRLGIKKVTLKLNARISGTLSGKKGDGDGDKTGRYVELYVKDTDHKASWSSWSNKPAIKNTLGSCRVRETGADYTEFSFDLTDYIKTRLSSAATDRSSFTLGLTAMQTNGASIAVDNTGAAAPQIIIETYEKELEPAANYTVAQEQNRCVEPNTLTVRSHVGTDVSKTAQSYISFSLNNPGSDMLKNELNAEDREIEKATLRFKAKLTSSLAAGDGSSDADGRFIWLFVRNVEQEGNEWQKWADRPAHKSNLHYSTHKVRITSECEYEIDVTSCVKQRVQQSGSLGDTVTFALSASGTNTGGISILNSLTDGNKPELIIETKNKPNENK